MMPLSFSPSRARSRIETLALKIDQRPDGSHDYSRYKNRPIAFMREVLHLWLTDEQKQVLRLMQQPPYRVLVPSANEQGKSILAAMITLWWFCTRSPARVITTAPKMAQLKKIVWKEIRRLARRAGLDLPFLPKACHIERAPDDFVTGTTATDATKFQGEHGPNQLFIFDEAVSIHPDIFEVTEGMFSPPGHAWICFFNPTDPGAQVCDEMVKAGRIRGEQVKRWHVVRMSADRHPNVIAELAGLPPPIPDAMRLDKFERLLRQWSQLAGAFTVTAPEGGCVVGGREFGPGEPIFPGALAQALPHEFAPLRWQAEQTGDIFWPPPTATEYIRRTGQRPKCYRAGPIADARLFGRIPRQGAYGVWSEGDWMAATREGLPPLGFPNDRLPEIGADIARFGDDWTSVHARLGFASIYHSSANGMDTVETTTKIIELCHEIAKWFNEEITPTMLASVRFGCTPEDIPIKIDDSGVGGSVTDQLRAAGFNAVPINAASKAMNPYDYPNRRSELWFLTAEMARRDELDLSRLGEDTLDEIRTQMLAPHWAMLGKRRVVEPKDHMKARLGRSPDDADSVNLAYCPAGGDVGVPTVIADRFDPTGDWASSERPTMADRPTMHNFGRERG
jgi:hypothetical protein